MSSISPRAAMAEHSALLTSPSLLARLKGTELARYAWCDFLQARQRPGAGSGDSEVLRALEAVEAGDDLVLRPEQQFDQELLTEARDRVRERVEAASWQAFQLTAVDGLSGAEAAGRLGVTVAAIFKAKSRVRQMLQDEVARLEGQ